jgi:hypothetical protein
MMALDGLSGPRLCADHDQMAAREPLLVQMSTVAPEEVAFLSHPYIPMRKLTMLIGDPGVAKTWLSLAIPVLMESRRRRSIAVESSTSRRRTGSRTPSAPG